MSSIGIKHAPKGWENDPRYVYFGRPRSGSPRDVPVGEHGCWGNPSPIGKRCPECNVVHASAGSTLKCYEKYLRRRLREPAFLEAARRLPEFKVCFCAGPDGLFVDPSRELCHVQVFERVMQEFQ